MVDIFVDLIKEGALEKMWMPEEDLATPIFDSGKIMGITMGNENVLESPVDYLTGLLSRQKGEHDISLSLRAEGGSLMLIDLDHFRHINDVHGHLMGDYALKVIADVLRDVCGNEIVCRTGGDEFLYYLAGITDEEVVTQKAEELLEAFAKKQEEVEVLKDAELSVGISISGADGREFDELYRRADKALYLVKQSRGKHYGFFQRAGILRTPEQSQSDLDKIMEAIKNQETYQGAFQVDYDEFNHVYDFVKHMSARSKKETQLLLFTLFSSNGSEVRLDRMETAMQCMEQAICKSLRGVDVGARYSSSQFLVVLLGTERENVRVVTDRIVQNYFKLYGEKDITLTYDIAKFG